jgi:LytS/YehU family sensor histidine kinase
MRDDARRHSKTRDTDARIDWRLGVAVALGLSVVFAAQNWLNDASTTSFGVLFARQLIQWLLWLAFVPIVFDIGGRLRRRGALRTSSIIFFIAASVVVATINAALVAVLRSMLDLAPAGDLGTAIKLAITSLVGANLVRFWALSAIFHAITYHKEVRERETNAAKLAANLAQERLETLEGRLQPQFLFNALSALTALIHTDPPAAEDMVGHLSELLRAALDVSGAREVTLARELELLEHYVAIQRARFQERLEVVIESEPEALAAYMPHCMLLPIVENAIRHGIGPRETHGKVSIRGTRRGDVLHLDVRDDGVGIGRAPAATNGRGVGIGSTRARLTQLYGNQASFTIGQVVPTGTLVTIELPFHTDATASDIPAS